ncbi:MAG: LPS export ABC transporter periplasmic protein LptC [Deferribacterales bacterium]
MGRYTKFILIASIILLVLASFTLFKRNKNKVTFDLAKNEVIIDNFEMGKVLDEQNNYYSINAKKAQMNRDKGTALLTDFAAHYKKDDLSVDLYAPQGYMENDFIIRVTGDIKGRINEFDFESEDNGNFHYDFLIGLGTFLGGVTIKNSKGTLSADKILIYSENNYAEFIGHVKVTLKK